MIDRLCNEREVLPSATIVDSQSVKAPGARTRGDDANKKLSGRKRHIAIDTDGRLLAVNLTPADIADSTGTRMVLDGLIKHWPWVKHLTKNIMHSWRGVTISFSGIKLSAPQLSRLIMIFHFFLKTNKIIHPKLNFDN